MSDRGMVAELLRVFAAVMADQHLRWYLFGAQAAIVWGSPRLSADVDVTAVIEPRAINGFIRAMEKHGFDAASDHAEVMKETRVMPFVHRTTRMPLDVVIAGPGLEIEFLERAIDVDLDGCSIPVITPEDLIVTKILAGRSKDIEDVCNVVHKCRASLDIVRIRTLLDLLQQALTQSDLLPLFEREWKKAQGET